jgi:CRISPR-associated endonuclease/helicase Cas3
MCPAHRSEVIAQIRSLAQAGSSVPCRVVSTQLVEAGVDLDFPVLYRSMAGLDSIAQAAGRCNREGRLRDEATGQLRKGSVYVFDPAEKEYQPFGSIKTAAQAASSALRRHRDDPLALDCVRYFFQLYYQAFVQAGWDARRVLAEEVLSMDADDVLMAQFRVMDKRFRLIEEGNVAILVPYGKEGVALCAKVRNPAVPLVMADYRMAQRYSVSVRERELQSLMSSGAVPLPFRDCRFYVLANSSAYDPCKGLDVAASGIWDAGELASL